MLKTTKCHLAFVLIYILGISPIIGQCLNEVSGYVYQDFNFNSNFDTSEKGITNFLVLLYKELPNDSTAFIDSARTNVNGFFQFNNVSVGKYRIDFIWNFGPNSYYGLSTGSNDLSRKISNNACNTNLPVSVPSFYCQDNPEVLATCFVSGDNNNATPQNSTLISATYNSSGNNIPIQTYAKNNEIGSVWGVSYDKIRKKIYTSAFVKRHIGLGEDTNGNALLGAIYETDPITKSSKVFLNLQDYGIYPGYIQNNIGPNSRGLGTNGLFKSIDTDGFFKTGKVGIGDIEVDPCDTFLYVMNLYDKTVYQFSTLSKNYIRNYPVPQNLCDIYTNFRLNVGGKAYVDSKNNEWFNEGYFIDAYPRISFPNQAISNTNNSVEGTTDAEIYRTAMISPELIFKIAVPNGKYSVRVHTMEFIQGLQRKMDLFAEDNLVLNDQVISGARWEAKSVEVKNINVIDGTMDLRFVAAYNASLPSVPIFGIEIIPEQDQKFCEAKPFALAIEKGDLYVGMVCASEYSQDTSKMKAFVLKWDKSSNKFNAIVNFKLNYQKGLAADKNCSAGYPCDNVRGWNPWATTFTYNLLNTQQCPTIYPQPILSDIEVDDDGSLVLGFMDRAGNQMAPNNYNLIGVDIGPIAVAAGDVLRVCNTSDGLKLEGTHRECPSKSLNAEGPGGGEFYHGDSVYIGFACHQESSYGGIALKNGSHEILMSAHNPTDSPLSGGVIKLSSENGGRVDGFRLYDNTYNTTNSNTSKANGIGDLALICNNAPIEFGNYVWLDKNFNGLQDISEEGIQGISVCVYDEKFTQLGCTVTDQNGKYIINDALLKNDTLQPLHTYYITFGNNNQFNPVTKRLNDTLLLSPADKNSLPGDDNHDSDAKITGLLNGLPYIKLDTVSCGYVNYTLDVGFYYPIILGDYVWEDLNGNGIQEASEPGINGDTVILLDGVGNRLDTTLTFKGGPNNLDGYYIFRDLTPGIYCVQFLQPCLKFTKANQGTNDNIDSDAHEQTGIAHLLKLSGGEIITSIDAGLYMPARLGNYVWEDINGNGIQEINEPGINNVLVRILDGAGNILKTTLTAVGGPTNANGYYQFEDLAPNVYQIQFVKPSGFELTKSFQGIIDTLDSDANTSTGIRDTITISSGESDQSIDAGLYVPASLGNLVWEDINGNGIQDLGEPGVNGVTVLLKDFAGVTLKSTVTSTGGPSNIAGYYQFSNLAPGDYRVMFMKPIGYEFTLVNQGSNANVDSDASPVNGNSIIVTLLSGETNQSIDAGIYRPARLGNFVWEDLNGNGIQEINEPGINGVSVILQDKFGITLASFITITGGPSNKPGYYQFTNLSPQAYQVIFIKPINYEFTNQFIGNDSTDSDANTLTGYSLIFNLLSNESNQKIDAGLYRFGSIGDYVWRDLDKDGIQDVNETGENNVTVKLLDANLNVIKTTSTITNQNVKGYYLFNNIPPATYKVMFVLPGGFNYSPMSAIGSTSNNDSDADPSTGMSNMINLSSAENNYSVDAGLSCSLSVTAGLDQLICFGTQALINADAKDGIGPYTYSWNNNLSALPSQQVHPSNSTSFIVTATDQNGCTATDEMIVNVNPELLVNAGGDKEICLNQSVQLVALAMGGNTVYNYKWSSGEVQASIQVSPLTSTTYTVTVTDGESCTAIDEVIINVNELPTVQVGTDIAICENQLVQLNAQASNGEPSYGFVWSTSENNSSINVLAKGLKTYTVTVTDANQCTAIDTIVVEGIPYPKVDLGPDLIVCDKNTAKIQANILNKSTINYAFLWSNGETTEIIEPTLNANNTFRVTVTDQYNCSASDEISVRIDASIILACDNFVRVSLPEECKITITPDMILEGVEVNAGAWVVVKDRFGNIIPSAMVDYKYIGDTLSVTVYARCGNVTNSCWGKILIEDKLAPKLECKNYNVQCSTIIQNPFLLGNSNIPIPSTVNYVYQGGNKAIIAAGGIDCQETELSFNDYPKNYTCKQNANLSGIIIRIWTALDKSGNTSTCKDTIFIKRIRIADLKMPSNYDDVDLPTLETCGNWDLNGDGYPQTNEVQSVLIFGCGNLSVLSKDQIIPICVNADGSYNSFKILRLWKMYDDCTGEYLEKIQTIKVEDKKAPILGPERDTVVSTYVRSCSGEIKNIKPIVLSECSQYTYSIESRWGTVQGNNVIDLPATDLVPNVIVITVTDACGNSASQKLNVYVHDDVAPTMICDYHDVVALDNSGFATLHAEAVGNASKDNCGIEKYEIKRDNGECDINNLTYHPSITFCCKDVNQPQKVWVRATDYFGNSNECDVMVTVQNKQPAIVFCPNNITIDCHQDYMDTTITGVATFDAVCGAQIEFNDNTVINLCGVGYVDRNWTATESNGIQNSCVQRITIEDKNPFNGQIVWPATVNLIGCMADASPDKTGEPKYGKDYCARITHTYKDQEFYNSDSSCIKILRKWSVLDWCTYEKTGNGLYEYTQIIKISNTTAPEIKNCKNVIVETNEQCTGIYTSVILAEDDCTASAQLEYKFRFEILQNKNDVAYRSGNGSQILLQEGLHQVHLTVTDLCGNYTSCNYTVEIKDLTPPKIYCNSSITTVIMPSSGDIELWAKDFVISAEENCNAPVVYSFDENNFVPNRIFTCNDISNGISENITVDTWVWDQKGNKTKCNVEIILQDNAGDKCKNKFNATTVTGLINTRTGRVMEGVNVLLDKYTTNSDALGAFHMEALNVKDTKLTAVKEDNELLGVTTADIVKIQKHILSTQLFTSPYEYIAADVNHSKTVTAADISILRKLILGILSPDDMWQLIVKDNNLSIQNPYAFQLNKDVIVGEYNSVDFVGVKMGDVNDDAKVNYTELAERTGLKSVKWYYTYNDEEKTLQFYNDDELDIYGFQLALVLPDEFLCDKMIPGFININEDNYLMSPGSLKISYSRGEKVHIPRNSMLFSITCSSWEFHKKIDILLASQDIFNSSVYDEKECSIILGAKANELKGFNLIRCQVQEKSKNIKCYIKSNESTGVRLQLVDMAGQELINKQELLAPGTNEINLDTRNCVNSVYVLRIYNDDQSQFQKIILTK